MFGRWKIAEAKLMEKTEETPEYHDTDMEILVWKTKKKKGDGKRVAIATLTKSGDIFVTVLDKRARKRDISKYQIDVAKAYLKNVRFEKMPNWNKSYPYSKKII